MSELISPALFAEYERAKLAQSRAFAAVEEAKRALAAAEHARDVAAVTVRDVEVQLLASARNVLGTIHRPRPVNLDTARYTKSDVRA